MENLLFLGVPILKHIRVSCNTDIYAVISAKACLAKIWVYTVQRSKQELMANEKRQGRLLVSIQYRF